MVSDEVKEEVISDLLAHMHPVVTDIMRHALIGTFTRQVARHADDKRQLEEVEKELASEDFGSW